MTRKEMKYPTTWKEFWIDCAKRLCMDICWGLFAITLSITAAYLFRALSI